MTATTADHAAADGRVSFILGLGRAMHESGYDTHDLEEQLVAMSERLGVAAQLFATPTSIFASFGSTENQRTYMLRTAPRPPDLGRLVRVATVARAVHQLELTPNAGTLQLAELARRPGPPLPRTAVGYTLASAAAARILGGGWPEIRMAAAAGLVTGLLAVVAGRHPRVGRIFELVAATACAALVGLAGVWWGGHSVPIATLAGLIVLIPGLTVTTAIAELATQHLTAGTTRLAGAFMTFIGIGFGVALGSRLASLAGAPREATHGAPAAWTFWAALVAAGLAFALLLRADRRDWLWIMASGLTAVLAARAGTAVLGAELGVFLGAFAVGGFANLFGRLARRPSPVVVVPGLLVLVPGSIGFSGVIALLDSQVVSGIGAGFTMFLTAVALVAGLLTAAAILPQRSDREPSAGLAF